MLTVRECFLAPDEREQFRISQMIQRQLDKDEKKFKSELKLLLLGPGESGKSTFIKQMKIIHGSGYSDEDRRGFKPVVFSNIIISIQHLINAVSSLGLATEKNQIQRHAKYLRDLDPKSVTEISKEQFVAIRSLWSDPAVIKAYERRREFHLSDSAKYYLDNLDRISSVDYVPNEQDILRTRVPTSGIHEYVFKVKDASFRMVDVGGQRSERRKWIHAFEGVVSVIFLVAISEFDQLLRSEEAEGKEVNRLQESVALFQTILGYPWFANSSIILFLNKKDLLEEKIAHSHLVDYFPEYKGAKGDYKASREFIANLLLHSVPQRSKDIYPHFTCATDTNNIKIVFESVRDHILTSHMTQMNL